MHLRLRCRALALLLGATALTAGCSGLSDLRLTQDDRLTLTRPASQQEVTLPFTVSWTVRDFDVVPAGTPPRPDSGYFAVFVDTLPMPPGDSLRDFAGPRACGADPKCPTAELLASYNVYVTDQLSVEIPRVGTGLMGTEGHQLIVVLLDGSGRRLGDSFWQSTFHLAGDAQAER